jgi:hypothetical protein
MAPGRYIGHVGLTTGNRSLHGCGQATIVNVVSGAAGLQVVGATQVSVSDMQFVVGSGPTALSVTGASDFNASNLEMSGSSAASGAGDRQAVMVDEELHVVVSESILAEGALLDPLRVHPHVVALARDAGIAAQGAACRRGCL